MPGGEWRQRTMRQLRMSARPSRGSTETRRGLWGVGEGSTSASVMDRAPLINTWSMQVALGTPPELE